jgi:cobalt/nickel transport protein
MKKRTNTVIILIMLTTILILFPLFYRQGSEFEGSDNQGSKMVGEIMGDEFEPWFNPIIESLIGGELSSEMETLFFCIQTGIGAGVIAYCFGYLVARKKYGKEEKDEAPASNKMTAQGV